MTEVAKPSSKRPRRPKEVKPTGCRLRCADHDEFAKMAPALERPLRLGVRLWPSVLSFEKQAAKTCADVPAPFAFWDQIDWLPFRTFMVQHADHRLELHAPDGEIFSLAASIGMNWKTR